MNERETRTTETATTITRTAGPVDGTMSEHPNRYAGDDAGTFAAGEETMPEKDAVERQEHLGTFAAGEETMPEKDAAERQEHLGTFAAGEETMPEKDAAERVNPGTFADTEHSA